MNTKICTSLKQSKELAEILPIETADMYLEQEGNLLKSVIGSYILHNQCMEDKDYKKLSNPVLSPAWSLSALLQLIPLSSLVCLGGENGIIEWSCGAFDGKDYTQLIAKTPIDAAFEMVVWLKENNKL